MNRIKQVASCCLVLALVFGALFNTLSFDALAVEDDALEVERLGEVQSLRETNSETYLLSNGMYECVVYADDKYYRDSSGELQLIDNSIVLNTVDSRSLDRQYVNSANAFSVSFSDDSRPAITMDKDGNRVTFSAVSASGGNSNYISADDCVAAIGAVQNCSTLGELTNTGSNTVTYANAFYNTDIVYVLTNQALKEYIILKNNNAPNVFCFMFSVDGLAMQTGSDGASFVDENGTTVFALDDLFAIDANGVLTENLTYSFLPVKDTGDMLVAVTVDEDYLSAADRVFPVVVDPSIMISSSDTADACVCEGYSSTNYQMATQLRTGYDDDYGIRRSYIQFNIPSSISGHAVTEATLDIEKLSGATPRLRAYRCTSSWSSATITWDNKPDYSVINASPECEPYREGSSWYTMDVTDVVDDWVNGVRPNYGFLIRDVIESDPNHWTTLYSSDAASPHKPELHITYDPDENSDIQSYTYTHYYDTTYASRISLITNAVSVANTVYTIQFNTSLSSKASPSPRYDLIGSHNDIISISNTLYNEPRDSNEIKVFWTDRPSGTYCNHETGTCTSMDGAIAAVYGSRPVIHMLSLVPSNGIELQYQACSALTLVHETAHSFGLGERYYCVDEHVESGIQCVMEPYLDVGGNQDYWNQVTFYQNILDGYQNAFCFTCRYDLLGLLS